MGAPTAALPSSPPPVARPSPLLLARSIPSGAGRIDGCGEDVSEHLVRAFRTFPVLNSGAIGRGGGRNGDLDLWGKCGVVVAALPSAVDQGPEPSLVPLAIPSRPVLHLALS